MIIGEAVNQPPFFMPTFGKEIFFYVQPLQKEKGFGKSH
jgi:hypothetical protein